MSLFEHIVLKLIQRKISKLFALECALSKNDAAIKHHERSPEKSWPDPAKIPSGTEVPFSLKNMLVVGANLKSCVHEGMKTIKSVAKNPTTPKTDISGADLSAFQDFALRLGVGAVGFAKLPPHLIFRDRAVLFDSAIVMIMEMDQEAIAKAPSLATFKMVMQTYDTLGRITNRLTEKLREMGFGAQASHPLGGLVLYPPLGVEAGLGWLGRHGLLITPQFGPRQRIAAIFTSVQNLPFSRHSEHSWIAEFCQSCGRCIATCPSEAILKEPIEHDSGRKTQIERKKCLPIFVKNEGCTICVKECVFSKRSYNEVREGWQN